MPLLSKPMRGIHGGTNCSTLDSMPPQQVQRCGAEATRAPRLSAAWNSVDGCWSSQEDVEDAVTYCCLPSGCPRYLDDPISLADTSDAAKVVCNNERCGEGEWMHGDCFQEWEEHILGYLRSCGRARSWSEKQRHQNLWTKKGYDLAFKVCDCKCGRGHLRYDLGYVAASKSDDERRMKKMKRRDRLSSVGNATMYQNGGMGRDMRSPLRIHRSSLSSSNGSWSGSSPPSSSGTTPVTPPGLYMPGSSRKNSGGHFDFFADADQATAGNIFRHRTDLHAFYALPHRLQNTYQIKTEDEGPHGNDEIRCLVLTCLSAARATSVHCVVCQSSLPVYDKYPLIDGTFFLSPVCYAGTQEDLRINDHHHRGAARGGNGGLMLNAVCMHCMEARCALACRACRTPWSGASLVIGTMYAYDVFAAVPCCGARLACNRCRQPLCDPASGFKFFSDYSRLFRCPCCSTEDYHFVKPLEEAFTVSARRAC